MNPFGERFRKERVKRGVSLEEVSEVTKISARHLRAIEECQFAKLPGGIFNKGFVRSYARFLEINEEQAIADYISAAGIEEEPAPPVAEPDSPTPTITHVEPRALLHVGVALAVLGAGIFTLVTYGSTLRDSVSAWYDRHEAMTKAQAAAPSSQFSGQPQAEADAAAGGYSVNTSTAQQNADPGSAGFEVVVHALEQAWISADIDGRQIAPGLLDANADRTFRAQRQLVLTTGNAGGVEIYYNGRDLGAAGQPNKKRILRFTPEGLQN